MIHRFATVMLLMAVVPASPLRSEIDPVLTASMEAAGPGDSIKALLFLPDQLDTASLNQQFTEERATRAHRHQVVVEALQSIAAHAQGDLLDTIDELQADGKVKSHRAFWIANLVQVEATVEGLSILAEHDDVMMMYLDHPIELIAPVDVDVKPKDQVDRGTPEDGVVAVGALECWAAGFDGTGVLVANMDTGVDGAHPALASRWRGNDPLYSGNPEWAWFDPYLNENPPYDFNGHGTHTMGTILGGSPGLPVGVAPGAEWIASAPIDRADIPTTVSDAIESFQWMTDPDGNPLTSWDVPQVCSNSWGLVTSHGYPECDETFWIYLDNCELAGTIIIFSAGNESSSGLRRPSDRATNEYSTFSVAAIDPSNSSWPVASFSSLGPTYCTPTGEVAIKPDISAPGVNTNSCYPGGGYTPLSGTSMASPHVNGVIAIMLQGNPELTPEVVKQIIYDTATDLGNFGEDNTYGYGMIDAWEALQVALSTVSLSIQFPEGKPELIDPNGGQLLRVLMDGNAIPTQDSGRLWYRTSGLLWQESEMNFLGGGEELGYEYQAIFPSFACGVQVEWYVSVETVDGDYVTSPNNAPSSYNTGDAWSGVERVYEDNFQTDNGWTVNGDAITGQWERGLPVGEGVRCEPASDADGSGQCYVTENAYGDFDIDDGSTTLTSPALDASEGGVLSYRRWYNNGGNCNGADPQNDIFVVEFSTDGGSSWYELEIVGPGGNEVSGGWVTAEFDLDAVPNFEPTEAFHVRFTASDLNAGSVVEAGLDAVLIDRYYCEDTGVPGDANGDGLVNVEDLLFIINQWGLNCNGCGPDLNDDGVVNITDLLLVITYWD